MKKLVFVVVLMTLMSLAAFADVAKPGKTPGTVPKPNPSIDTTLSIRLDKDAKEATLIIPRGQLKTLRAALDEADGGNSVAAGTGISRLQTIVAGFFLSLAIIFGGVLFARSRRIAAAAVVLMAALSGALFVFGNAGPPSEARSITSKMFTPAVHMYGFGYGRIKMEVSDTAEQVQLIVPDPKTSATPAE